MAKKWILIATLLLPFLTTAGRLFADSSQAKVEQPKKPEKWAVSQIGFAFEERPNYANAYLFTNQLINKHWYYELRTYGIYNWIVNNPPKDRIDPLPLARDEKNQWGWGGVAIFGHVFDLCDKVTFMPFFRLQAQKNASYTYRDKFHNRVDSRTLYYLIGGKLSMGITDFLLMYAQYYGGYFRANFTGKGYFSKTPPAVLQKDKPAPHPMKHAHINGLAGTMEFGARYKMKCRDSCGDESTWILTPYLQFSVLDNNIDYRYTVPPYSLNPLTTSNIVFAFKVGREF